MLFNCLPDLLLVVTSNSQDLPFADLPFPLPFVPLFLPYWMMTLLLLATFLFY